MNHEKLINFLRGFRRPYASILCATTLCVSVIIAGFTGEWMPVALAGVLAAVIGIDTVARSHEKTQKPEDPDA